MDKRKHLLAVVGTVILLLSLTVPIMQCAPAAEEVTPPAEEEEVTPPPEEEIAPPPEEEEIKYGGRLNIGFTAALPSLRQGHGVMYTNWGCLWDMIVYDNWAHFNLPPDYYAFTPEFVQSYETSEDGLTWTLHLAEGATWHDGVPVTAEDIKFNCELDIARGGTDIDFCVDHVEVIDDYTVKVVNTRALTTTNPPGWWSWNPLLPKHIFEPYGDDIEQCPNEESIGSGPFKLKEFKPGQYMWLEAYEDYYGGRPYVDEVIFRLYPTLETMLMALEKGEVDVFGNADLPAALVEEYEANPDIAVEVVDGISMYDLSFNLHKDTPLRDKSVRKAIAYSIDRDRIIDMAFMGYAVKSDSWVYKEDPMHNPNLPQYAYDPDKANEILDGAGYLDSDGDGIRNDPTTGENLVFELMCSASDVTMVKVATLLEELLPDIGVGVDLASLDYDTYASYIWNPPADAYEMGIRYVSPSPPPYGDWIWIEGMSWGSGGDWWNPSYYDNPHYNELVVSMTTAESMEERKEYMYEMQEILSEDLPEAFLVRGKNISVYRTDKFEGWENQVGGPVSWMNDWSILKVHLK